MKIQVNAGYAICPASWMPKYPPFSSTGFIHSSMESLRPRLAAVGRGPTPDNDDPSASLNPLFPDATWLCTLRIPSTNCSDWLSSSNAYFNVSLARKSWPCSFNPSSWQSATLVIGLGLSSLSLLVLLLLRLDFTPYFLAFFSIASSKAVSISFWRKLISSVSSGISPCSSSWKIGYISCQYHPIDTVWCLLDLNTSHYMCLLEF